MKKCLQRMLKSSIYRGYPKEVVGVPPDVWSNIRNII